ncbi:MAG: hypothetical protein HXY42_12530 [Chloroflexi bacterium]|nr:hypothetical protein [Chloroflexota bacterium]
MQEGWNLAPILIPLAALLVGWTIGFFDSNLRATKKIKQAEDSARAAIEEAKKRLEEEQKQLTTELPDDPGLLRLKNENGILTLELDGTRVDASTVTPQQRKRLIELLNAIRPWLEGKSAATLPHSPAPAPKADTRQTASTPVPPPPSQAVAPSAAPVSKPAPAASKKAAEPLPAPTSIVEQINLILQAQIAHTALAARGVVLLESPTGGVNVYIGIEKYEGVEAVPDEEVKVAIRAAIAEWERKYTPGL